MKLKKNIIISIILIMLFSCVFLNVKISNDQINIPVVHAVFSGGGGTSSDPYLIKTVEDYKNMVTYINEYDRYNNSSVYYKIDSGTGVLDFDKVLVSSINDLYANIDGSFTTLKNLSSPIAKINRYGTIQKVLIDYGEMIANTESTHEEWKCIGAIANINYSTIKYCGVTNTTIKDTQNNEEDGFAVGGIAGINYGSINNCYVYGSTIKIDKDIYIAKNKYHINCAGGIVGYAVTGTIDHCIVGNGTTISSGGFIPDPQTYSYNSSKTLMISRLSGGIFGLTTRMDGTTVDSAYGFYEYNYPDIYTYFFSLKSANLLRVTNCYTEHHSTSYFSVKNISMSVSNSGDISFTADSKVDIYDDLGVFLPADYASPYSFPSNDFLDATDYEACYKDNLSPNITENFYYPNMDSESVPCVVRKTELKSFPLGFSDPWVHAKSDSDNNGYHYFKYTKSTTPEPPPTPTCHVTLKFNYYDSSAKHQTDNVRVICDSTGSSDVKTAIDNWLSTEDNYSEYIDNMKTIVYSGSANSPVSSNYAISGCERYQFKGFALGISTTGNINGDTGALTHSESGYVYGLFLYNGQALNNVLIDDTENDTNAAMIFSFNSSSGSLTYNSGTDPTLTATSSSTTTEMNLVPVFENYKYNLTVNYKSITHLTTNQKLTITLDEWSDYYNTTKTQEISYDTSTVLSLYKTKISIKFSDTTVNKNNYYIYCFLKRGSTVLGDSAGGTDSTITISDLEKIRNATSSEKLKVGERFETYTYYGTQILDWKPTLSGDNSFTLDVYCYPKVEFNLDSSIDDESLSTYCITAYSLTGTDLIFTSDYKALSLDTFKSITDANPSYVLLGVYSGKLSSQWDDKKMELDASLAISTSTADVFKDGKCTKSDTSEITALYVHWITGTDHCKIIIEQEYYTKSTTTGTKKLDDTDTTAYYFYYMTSEKEDLPNYLQTTYALVLNSGKTTVASSDSSYTIESSDAKSTGSTSILVSTFLSYANSSFTVVSSQPTGVSGSTYAITITYIYTKEVEDSGDDDDDDDATTTSPSDPYPGAEGKEIYLKLYLGDTGSYIYDFWDFNSYKTYTFKSTYTVSTDITVGGETKEVTGTFNLSYVTIEYEYLDLDSGWFSTSDRDVTATNVYEIGKAIVDSGYSYGWLTLRGYGTLSGGTASFEVNTPLSDSKSVKINAVYSKAITREASDYTKTNTSGVASYKTVTISCTRTGYRTDTKTYNINGNLTGTTYGAEHWNGWVLPSQPSTLYHADLASTYNPNGYVYDSSKWLFNNDTSVSWGGEYSSGPIYTCSDGGTVYIYQGWQYANYMVTLNLNKFTNFGTRTYTTVGASNTSLSFSEALPSEYNGYTIVGWYITGASIANNDDNYNISTTGGFINKNSTGWNRSDSHLLNSSFTYNSSNKAIMYGNFTLEPKFGGSTVMDLVLNYGISGVQHWEGYSKYHLYGENEISYSATETSYTTTININGSLDLSTILNEIYRDIPKFYNSNDKKYYLVGWTNSANAKTYNEPLTEADLSKIYSYDTGVLPGSVALESGGLHAVWATLYEVRIALTSSDTTSLYRDGTLIQSSDILYATEPWQDSYTADKVSSGKYYYTIYYGQTLTNADGLKISFDPYNAIGQNTSVTSGYGIDYKRYLNTPTLADLSLMSLSGFELTNGTFEKVYNTPNKLEFSGDSNPIDKLIEDYPGLSIINIYPKWVNTTFNVIVKGDSEHELDIIKYYEKTFTINAKGDFDFWPDDSSRYGLIDDYEGWYLSKLKNSNGKDWETIIQVSNKLTGMPVGTDFYNKILEENSGIKQKYTIEDVDGKLTLNFTAYYEGAVYALKISHIGSDGEAIDLDILDISTTVENFDNIYKDFKNSYKSNGTSITNNGVKPTNTVVKYQYIYGACVDNSDFYQQYQNLFFMYNSNYYMTITDKTSFKLEDFKNRTNLESAKFGLDFYDYSATTANTGEHIVYDMNGLSIETRENVKSFAKDSEYSGLTSYFSINYTHPNSSWTYGSGGVEYSTNMNKYTIYARWQEKLYYLDMSTLLEGNDSNGGYLVTEVKYGTRNKTDYYALVYIKSNSGAWSYNLYKIPNIDAGRNFYTDWKNIEPEHDNRIRIPAGGTITIYSYDQSKDNVIDDMLGYRFKSVNITMPKSTTDFLMPEGETNYIKFDNFDGTNCNYTKTSTQPSPYIINSNGITTIISLNDDNLNASLEVYDTFILKANLEKINYTLTANMDNVSAGKLDYSHKEDIGYGVSTITLANIQVGDQVKIRYKSNVGYKLDNWQFTNSYSGSKVDEAISLIWKHTLADEYRVVDGAFLRNYTYYGCSVAYSVAKNQNLGTLTTETSLIPFTIEVEIIDINSKDSLDTFILGASSKLINKSDGTSFVAGSTYTLTYITTPRNSNKHCVYYNSGEMRDYAVLETYLKGKGGVGSFEKASYEFPIASLPNYVLEFSSSLISDLVTFTVGNPIEEGQRKLKMVINVAKVVKVKVNNPTTDSLDPKLADRVLKANNVVIASANTGNGLTTGDVYYAYEGQQVKFTTEYNANYYSGVKISYNDTEPKELEVNAGPGKSIQVNSDLDLTAQFLLKEKTLNITISYHGTNYPVTDYALLKNLADKQVLISQPTVLVKSSDGTVTRTTKYFYEDKLTLSFGANNFATEFVTAGVVSEFEYHILANGVEQFSSDHNYNMQINSDLNIIIQIFDLSTSTVLVRTSHVGCGDIYGVSKSGLELAITDSDAVFPLVSGDDLTIYIKPTFGYTFKGYKDSAEHEINSLANGTDKYEGYLCFDMITNYETLKAGIYILMFNLDTFTVELVYDVEGETNASAGNGYKADKTSVNIFDSLNLYNEHGTAQATVGYKFIGYSLTKSYANEGEILDGGSYQTSVQLIDVYKDLDPDATTLTVYANFIKQYKINISVAGTGDDYGQVKLTLKSVPQSGAEVKLFENYRKKNLPYSSNYLDSKFYDKFNYKLVMDDPKGDFNKYIVKIYLNGALQSTGIQDSESEGIRKIVYTFELSSKSVIEYNIDLEFTPIEQNITLKEYYINTVEEAEDYKISGSLAGITTKHEALIDSANLGINGNKTANLAYDNTNIIVNISSLTSLAGKYNLEHLLSIKIVEECKDWCIYQVLIDGVVAKTNSGARNSAEELRSLENISFTLSKDMDIQIVYKRVYKINSTHS